MKLSWRRLSPGSNVKSWGTTLSSVAELLRDIMEIINEEGGGAAGELRGEPYRNETEIDNGGVERKRNSEG